MLKKRIFRVVSAMCALFIAISCLNSGVAEENDNSGRLAAVYAYTLNDYIYTYGTLSTTEENGTWHFDNGDEYPKGVMYSEVINFDADKEPYLAIFLADPEYTIASCHIWRYNEEKDKAERIAILDVNYRFLTNGKVGTFSMGFNGNKRYIVYKVFENDVLKHEDYYTAIDGDSFRYVKTPPLTEEIGVADFSERYFHPGTDVSHFNKQLNLFFDSLKNASADSVTYENIAERLSAEDEAQIESVLGTVTGFTNFDIADYSSMEAYREAVDVRPDGDRFYLISEAYNLGDEIYYVRFSTDRSYYNYALLQRSDDAPDGYQILKVRTDCIPLSDTELKQLKTDYDRNTLLYKKAKGTISLKNTPESDSKQPMFSFKKIFDDGTKLPIVCVIGGVAVALLTILWVYMYSDNN